MFRVFRSLLLLIFYLVPFSPFSSLGAGSDERTKTPLGAHQKRISFANKGEHGCCNSQPNYVSCIRNSTLSNLLHQCIISFASFHSHQSLALNTSLYETKKNFSPKMRELFLTRKMKKILRCRIASTSIEYRRNNDQTTANSWFSLIRTAPEIGQR